MTLSVAGTLTIAGAPAPNGTQVEIWSFNVPPSVGNLLSTVSVSGGAGGFSFVPPDDSHKYRAIFDDGTHRGLSALQGPLGGSSDPVGPATTMTVALADSPDPVTGFTNITYTITPTTVGADGATSVTVVLTLHASLTFVSSTGTGWVHTRVGQVVTAQIGFMAPGAGKVAPVVVVATAANTTALISSTVVLSANNAPSVNATQTTQVNAAVTGDGPGGLIQVPANDAAHFSLTGRHLIHAYMCQEASGNLIDQVGSTNLVAAGSPLYQQTVSGWTRKGIGMTEASGQRFTVGAGVGWNATTTPVAMMILFTARTTTALRAITILTDAGSSSRIGVAIASNGVLQTQAGAATNSGTVDHRDTLVHPLLITYDPGASTINRYTDLEKDGGTFATALDNTKGIGAYSGQNSHLGEILAIWVMSGTDAQFTDAQAKTHIQAFGFTITAWS